MIHALALAGAVAVAKPKPPPWVDVGTRRLFRCRPSDSGVSVPGYCDVLRVPLDWREPSLGTIAVRYQWIPARDGGAAQTIVALDGGPGFPTTADGDGYVRLFGPLLRERNLLLMDERGTGGSTPIDCEPLQRAVATDAAGEAFQRAVAACGAQLNHTFPAPGGGGYVHASDLFATTQSIRDLAEILRVLRLTQVDLYGDSYGTFFAQAFAVRYPAAVRALVLDSAYPLDQDMIDAPARAEIRFAFDAACARSAACSAAAPGSSLARIRRLARRLESSEFVSPAHEAYDTTDLAELLQFASLDAPPIEYRELDAAVRSWLDRSDPAPLARLFHRSWYSALLPQSFWLYSAGMEVADECTVYRNPFDLRSPLGERARQYRAALAALRPETFDPLPAARVAAAPPFPFDECLRWPAPAHDEPLVTATPPLLPPSVPVLMLTGELDSVTAPGDAALARAALGPSARLVVIPNEGHVPTLYDRFGCAQRIVRAFVAAPAAALDTSCTARIPEVRAVGVFPLTLADQPPAARRRGDRATPAEARLVALAVAAMADAIASARFVVYNGPSCKWYRRLACAPGLRGGEVIALPDASVVGATGYRYSRDTSVTGVALIDDALVTGGEGRVLARIRIRSTDGKLGATLTARWDERVPRARATIDGKTADGRAIHEEMPAP